MLHRRELESESIRESLSSTESYVFRKTQQKAFDDSPTILTVVYYFGILETSTNYEMRSIEIECAP